MYILGINKIMSFSHESYTCNPNRKRRGTRSAEIEIGLEVGHPPSEIHLKKKPVAYRPLGTMTIHYPATMVLLVGHKNGVQGLVGFIRPIRLIISEVYNCT